MKLIAGLALMVMTAGVPATQALACSKPSQAAGVEAGLIDWINGQRSKQGLSALRASGKLYKAAEAHACDMAKRSFFGHKGPGGPNFLARLKKSGYRFSNAVENIAKSQTTSVDKAAGLWRKSSAHWANILNPGIREAGIAVATDGTNTYYVFVGGSQ